VIRAFQNEILGDVNGSTLPQYNISTSSGTLLNAMLELANPVTQQGTPHTADVMNNMFSFENALAIRNARMRTIGLGTDRIETIYEEQDGTIIARTVAMRTSNTWHILEELYNAGVLIQSREATFAQIGIEWEGYII